MLVEANAYSVSQYLPEYDSFCQVLLL